MNRLTRWLVIITFSTVISINTVTLVQLLVDTDFQVRLCKNPLILNSANEVAAISGIRFLLILENPGLCNVGVSSVGCYPFSFNVVVADSGIVYPPPTQGEWRYLFAHEAAHIKHRHLATKFSSQDYFHHQEFEADTTAVLWMLEAGYSADDAISFLERVYDIDSSTHPSPKRRIENIKAVLASRSE